MPQMSPMLWLFLYLLFLLTFLMFNILNYFNFVYKNNQINLNNQKLTKNYFSIWKW